jgi:hypothetical protein
MAGILVRRCWRTDAAGRWAANDAPRLICTREQLRDYDPDLRARRRDDGA